MCFNCNHKCNSTYSARPARLYCFKTDSIIFCPQLKIVNSSSLHRKCIDTPTPVYYTGWTMQASINEMRDNTADLYPIIF